VQQNVSAFEIKKALAKRHGNREFFITECKTGPTGPGMLQFDGLAIYKSWAHPNIVGYEIKTSRSDFLRDNKYTRYMPYCHEFYFVTPTGLVQRQELEESIGLIWYNPATGALTTKKKAIHRNIEISAELLLYVIMSRLDSEKLPFTSDKTEYWKAWLENKISDRELGYQVKSKLLNRIAELEQELRRYRDIKDDLEELKAIDAVMEKHGIRSYWRRAETLDEALSRGYPRELDNLQRKLQDAVASIERIKKTYQKEAQGYDEQIKDRVV